MAIDPSIIGQLQGFRAPDLGAARQQAMQVAQMRQREQMMQMQMAQAQREEQERLAAIEQQKKVAGLWQQAGGDDSKFLENLRGAGLMQPYLQAEEAFNKRRKSAAEAKKTDLEAGQKDFELRQNRVRDIAQRFLANPNPQFRAGLLDHAVKTGWLQPEDTAAFTRMFDTDESGANPNLLALAAKPDDVAKMFAPDRKAIDLGGTQQFVDMNALTNPNQGPMQKTATPGEVLTDDRGRLTLAETIRNNNMDNAVAQGNLQVNRGQLGVSQGNLRVNQGRLDLDRTAPRGVPLDSANGPLLVDPRTGEARPVMVGGQAVPPKMSENTKKELDSLDSQTALMDEAINAVSKTPSAFSFGRGMATKGGDVTEALASRMQSPEERQTRAFVFNNVSKVINERAGAAQSAQELARLRGFLPGDLDTAEQVVDKAKAFKQYLKTQRDVYSTPVNQRQQSGAAPPAAEPAPAPKEQQSAPKAQTFNSLPMPQQYTGKTVRDTTTGQRFRSDGRAWVPVQ